MNCKTDHEDEPLKGSNQQLIRRSLATFVSRPLIGSFYYSVYGIVGAAVVGSYGGILFQTTLYMEAIFLLGPMGAANGLLSAARSIVLESGMAAQVGREVYKKALDIVQDEKESSQNIKEAIENLRESYPLTESLVTGEGVLGYIAQAFLGVFLPSVGQVFEQIEKAIEWSEEHQDDLADTEVVARATIGYLDGFLSEKEDLVASIGTLLYTTIAGVSLTLSLGIESLID